MVRQATALVTVVMCLMAISEAGYGAANGGLGEVPMVAALVVLPLLYVVPATRPMWLRHRYPLLAVQAALTCLPFALFGQGGIPGPSGWLAGLVLLTSRWPGGPLPVTALAWPAGAVLRHPAGSPGAAGTAPHLAPRREPDHCFCHRSSTSRASSR